MAHSSLTPSDAVSCPLEHYANPEYGMLKAHAFGAVGLMACPTTDDAWKVVLAVEGASVPAGTVKDYLEFDALTLHTTRPAAWQYT